MNREAKHVLGALAIALVLGVTYVMNFGLYPRFFDIEWDEEVRLHDGRVIWVHVKNTYERQSALRLKQYDENSIQFRRKHLTFELDTGKKFTFTTRMPVAYLGQLEKKWYVVLEGEGYGNYPDEMPDHWGNDFAAPMLRLAILQDDAFIPVRWVHAPAPLNTTKWHPNLMRSVFWSVFSEWNGKKLPLDQKKAFDDLPK